MSAVILATNYVDRHEFNQLMSGVCNLHNISRLELKYCKYI